MEQRNLFVIYKGKNELYSNFLRKLVDKKDDDKEKGEIVGTEDGTVSIIPWEEKQWLDNKGSVDSSEKVLFIGDVKGVDNLIPIIDEKYNEYGITYGWAGKQAVIYAEDKALRKKENYLEFLEELKKEKDIKIVNDEKKIGFNKRTVLKGVGTMFLPTVWTILAGSLIKDAFDDKKTVKEQQYLFGIVQMYKDHLDEFMKK